MRSMLKAVLCAAVTATLASAQSCSSNQEFNAIDTFSQTRGCLPSGYSQAMDAGQTTPDALAALCSSMCTSKGPACQAYVGQLFKAGDSNLYTGQCFLYPSAAVPSGPAQCVDAPSQLIAGSKDDTNACLASSTDVASAFCSSFVSVSTVTTYVSTTTPVTVVTTRSTSTTETTKTSTSKTTETSVALTLTATKRTVDTTVQTSTITKSTAITTTTASTTYSTVTITSLGKRQFGSVVGPACLSTTSVPDSRLSSACSCLGVTTVTTSLVSTAPTSTSYQVSTVYKTSRTTTVLQTTSTKLSTTRTTLVLSSTRTVQTRTTTTSTTSFVSTTTVSAVSTATSVIPPIIANGGFDGSITSWDNSSPGSLHYTTDGCLSAPGCITLDLGQQPNGSWLNFFRQLPVTFTAGVQYTASFSIKMIGSNPNCTPTWQWQYWVGSPGNFQYMNVAWSSPGGASLTNDWKTFTGTWTAPRYDSTYNQIILSVQCLAGSGPVSVVVDSMSIVKA